MDLLQQGVLTLEVYAPAVLYDSTRGTDIHRLLTV
jgi:hypothetical protein